MSEYLESLKADLAEAQKRFQEAQQEAQRVNIVFQAAHADVQALTRIVEKQTRKEETSVTAPATAQSASVPTDSLETEVNKTELIRETLRQHAGLTPGELFDVVKSQVGRAYVYSVLKRLRDNEEVFVRRKKYFLKHPTNGEGGQGNAAVN